MVRLLGPRQDACSGATNPSRRDRRCGGDPELKEKILAQGITPRSIGLRDFDAHIRKDMDRLEPLLRTIARSN